MVDFWYIVDIGDGWCWVLLMQSCKILAMQGRKGKMMDVAGGADQEKHLAREAQPQPRAGPSKTGSFGIATRVRRHCTCAPTYCRTQSTGWTEREQEQKVG
jgi:hypothetical protein